ncbi:MAG: hypothetical protein J6V73_07195 [Spirochaetaceae bacterium]|nr:hypothetical protein [Spirochaetaceae bacterium]
MKTSFFTENPVAKRLILALVLVLQISVIAAMFVRAAAIRNEAVQNNSIIRLSCTAYDPFDPFKGRYVRLSINRDELEAAGRRLGLDLSGLAKTSCDYYMQENYAREVDKINWQDFNNLKPVLELYVDKKGRAIQKALLVFDGTKEIPIEEYIRARL